MVRDVHSLSDDQSALLEQTMQAETSCRARARAHSVLLSAQGTTIKDIATTDQGDRDTVARWSTPWAPHGAQSFHAKPRNGRPSTRTPDAPARAQH